MNLAWLAVAIALSGWRPMPSDGVTMAIAPDAGAMRLDFDFHGHGGYAIAHKDVAIDLPPDYEIDFRIRGEAPSENLELKLIDGSGDNVWWRNRRDFVFPRQWTELRTRRRQIEFAWGPLGGGEIRHVAAIEIVVTAGSGGKGSVWIDDVRVVPRAVVTTPLPRDVSGIVDLGVVREIGGVTVDAGQRPAHQPPSRRRSVYLSDDGHTWREVWRGRNPYVPLPETDARFIRVDGAQRFSVEPPELAATKNALFQRIARDAPRGLYPRAFTGEQSYWTIFGAPGAANKYLINEDGAIEVDPIRFSIEPFFFTRGKLITWNDVQTAQSLDDGYLPIPTVRWTAPGVKLTITAFAEGEKLQVRYRVRGNGKLFLAIRPFQVNPPWQFLGRVGGVTELPTVQRTYAGSFGAVAYADGDVVDSLKRGMLPRQTKVRDPFAAASAAYAYTVHGSRTIDLGGNFDAALARVRKVWHARLDKVRIDIPDQDLVRTMRSNLAFILINAEGPALRPGSRAYARSWIRDGAMMSAALLRLGERDVVRDYIRWFAKYQYADGKVPCCVDHRGADPVPENDSDGEFLFLVAEYYRFTHDDALRREMRPHIDAALRHIRALREPSTGLMPASISHEGYSAKPEHSYWDDFWTLQGLRDAGADADAKQMERDITKSIEAAMAAHHIDYIPGCVELGDFDPTSTTIAVAPADDVAALPHDALLRTFDRYWENAQHRTGENYTPYELRTVGTFVRLGQRERAQAMLDFFMRDRRPPAWNGWAEVVWRDPKTPKFIGDLPHAWVGSDYIRSFLDMFAYEKNGALILGAGLKPEWIAKGVRVEGLRTRFGTINYSVRGGEVKVWGDAAPFARMTSR